MVPRPAEPYGVESAAQAKPELDRGVGACRTSRVRVCIEAGATLSCIPISIDFLVVGKVARGWNNPGMPLPDPWRFPRLTTALHYASLLEDAPRRPLAIFGPRQVGKTHFLTHDLREAAEAKGWEPIYADLWGETDPLAAINTALAAILRRITSQTGRTPVTNVGALGVTLGLAAPAAMATPSDSAALLATQFAEFVRLQPKRPALLMLDEAQTLVKPGAGDMAMKAIRALFNSHPGDALLVFTGSSKGQLMSLVGDHSKTAFKLAAHMDFPLLGIAFVTFAAERFRQITQREVALAELDWAFTQLLYRPGEMIDFIRFMITETPGASVRTALDAFKATNRPDAAFLEQFSACTPIQQAVLKELAAARKLFSRDTRQQMARSLGQPAPVAPASVHNALNQLEAKGLIAKGVGRGLYQYEDEQLRLWINEVGSSG